MAERRFGRLLLLVLIVLTLGAASACGSDTDEGNRRVNGEGDDPSSEALAWAGFGDTKGLELVDAMGETGIDTLVMFQLRGSPDDVDRALEAADFRDPPTPGATVSQPPLEVFDPEQLEKIVSAEDRWENAEGRTLHRLYMRGETSGGEHVLHVWAFTT